MSITTKVPINLVITMTTTRIQMAFLLGILLLPFAVMGTAQALSVSCAGTPGVGTITWAGTASSGVAPYAFLWSNGNTAQTQTVSVSPGVYSTSFQVTDASSTVATTTCSTSVATSTPTIQSFTASPASITAGGSATLLWTVTNASSTSINGVGTVTGTSVSVSPTVTTVYTLNAINPHGSASATVTVTVVAASTPPNALVQIQALLAQIEGLKKQIALLLVGHVVSGGSSTTTATTTPAACFGFWRDLKKGDSGDDVRELQQMLAHQDPTLFPPGLVNGSFGPKTFAALKHFQKRFGIDLSGTGFFGTKSRSHFAALCSNGDKDKDGIPNVSDPDDDNDGTPDITDRFPFNASATSTPLRKEKADKDDRGKGSGKRDNDDRRGKNDDEDDD